MGITVLKTKGTVFSTTDRPRLVNNIFIFSKYMPKEPELFRAVITTRCSLNRTIFERVNGNTKGVFP